MCWSVGGIGNIEHSFSESSYIQFDYAGQITLVFVIHNVKHFLFCYEYDIKLATACKKHYAIYFFETFRFAPVFLLLLLDRQKKKKDTRYLRGVACVHLTTGNAQDRAF